MRIDDSIIPPRQLRALVGHVHGLTHADIGRRMGITRQAAQRLVKKAKANLAPLPRVRPRRYVWEIERETD